jgi:tetratricopeptide (TPR) repeat protein
VKSADPWTKLAIAYDLIGDQASFDRLLERHPQVEAGIGDLYAADEDWQRAIDLYSKLITDDTTDATLLARRAVAYIATEQWDLAKADWLRAIELQPDQLQQAFDAFRKAEQWSTAVELGQRLVERKPPAKAYQWLPYVPVFVSSSDPEAYRNFCRRMAQQFPASGSLNETDCVIKASLIWPGMIKVNQPHADRLAQLLDEGNESAEAKAKAWGTRALLAYRTGDDETAVKYIANSEQLKPHVLARPFNQAVLAMAHMELNHPDEAKAALAEATLLITQLNKDPDKKGHHDLLIAEILFREAEAKINGKKDSAAETADSSASSDKTPPPTDSTDKDVLDNN